MSWNRSLPARARDPNTTSFGAGAWFLSHRDRFIAPSFNRLILLNHLSVHTYETRRHHSLVMRQKDFIGAIANRAANDHDPQGSIDVHAHESVPCLADNP